MNEYEYHKTEKSTYVWSGNNSGSDKMHPKFYERIDGRTVRVSNKRGLELINEGEFEMTERLKIYFKSKKLLNEHTTKINQ